MGTIVVSAEKVIQAAEKTIAHILAIREESDKQTIAWYIQKHTPGKIGTFFARRAPTEIQAFERIKREWGYEFPNNYTHGAQLSHAKRLLKLAQNGDPVTLNETDCDMIF